MRCARIHGWVPRTVRLRETQGAQSVPPEKCCALCSPDVGDLVRLRDVLNENADDLGAFVTSHPQGKHLQPFLDQLATGLAGENTELSKELDSLLEGIEHSAHCLLIDQGPHQHPFIQRVADSD